MVETVREYVEGCEISRKDSDFDAALRAAVDYRGDAAVELQSGKILEGYIFNHFEDRIELYPKTEAAPISVPVAEIQKIDFSGADTAQGKSWAEWVKKKEAAKTAEAASL